MALVLLLIMFSGLVPPLFFTPSIFLFSALFLTSWERGRCQNHLWQSYLSIFVGITSGMPVLTHNIFLAALFGGIITGAGLGLVFRGNASTGGTAIISQIVNKYFKVSLGIAILFVDGLVILSAMYAFNADIVLFSLICLFTIGRVVDMIQVGLVRSKNVMIISPKYVAIQERLLRELDKGVTLVPIEGGYRNAKGMLLMTVIREKISPLKRSHS